MRVKSSKNEWNYKFRSAIWLEMKVMCSAGFAIPPLHLTFEMPSFLNKKW